MIEWKAKWMKIQRSAGDILVSPRLLRFAGIFMVVLGIVGIAKGLFGDLSEGELWWGYVGTGVLSIAFSFFPFVFATAEAEMRHGPEQEGEEENRPGSSKENTARHHTLH